MFVDQQHISSILLVPSAWKEKKRIDLYGETSYQICISFASLPEEDLHACDFFGCSCPLLFVYLFIGLQSEGEL